ncbi:MAG: hypothetical protein CMJ32_05660 [Phycisphaerae bacterium]|nr:hypothetical protein [Phycisphaerae bacterium]
MNRILEFLPVPAVALAMLLYLPVSVHAQASSGSGSNDATDALNSDSNQETGQGSRPTIAARLGAGFRYDFAASLDGGGKMARASVNSSLDVEWNINDQMSLAFRGDGEIDFYDFSGPTTLLAGGDPWDRVQQTGFRAVFRYKLDRWTFSGGGIMQMGWEEDADIGKSITWGGSAGFSYTFSDTLVLGFALAITSRIEDDALFVPIPMIDWRFADKWRISTMAGPAAIPTSGGELIYSITPEIDLALGARWEYRRFRLNDSGPIARRDGVGTVQGIPVWFRMMWRPCKLLRLDGVVGLNAWQKVTLENSGGGLINDTDADPSPFVAAYLTLTF